MADQLRVRAYNVCFGDAFLVSVPDKDEEGKVTVRHILIDVGNAVSAKGVAGRDDVFAPVVEDVLKELDGKPLDLYVMTHEHMDHVQGLYFVDEKVLTNDDLRARLATRHAWLTASAEKDYYDNHPEARKKSLALVKAYEEIGLALEASGTLAGAFDRTVYANNEFFIAGLSPHKTADCVDFLRNLAQVTSYVHREFDVNGKHPFNEARFEIWAPEEDNADYFRPVRHASADVVRPDTEKKEAAFLNHVPPSGVDAGTFFNLIRYRRQFRDILLAIDKAGNNTSVVFFLEWRGWRLLFTGDAEEKSWAKMAEAQDAQGNPLLKPVHFLKVSHHGSCNGTPDEEILNQILPMPRPDDGRKRVALVSTFEDAYGGIPHEPTLDMLRGPFAAAARCDQVIRLDKVAPGAGTYYDIVFEDLGQ